MPKNTVKIQKDTVIQIHRFLNEYLEHITDCPNVPADGFVAKHRHISETIRQLHEDLRLLQKT